MRIFEVAAGLDEPGAGPSYSVSRLTRALRAQEDDAELHCVLGWRAPPNIEVRPAPHRYKQDYPRTPLLGSLCLSSDLHRALLSATSSDVVHTHGLWLMPNIYPAWAAKRTGAALVISPRGMLGPAALAFSNRRKVFFWRLLQAKAVTAADCLHATSESEHEEIRAFGLRNPVAIIPNGVDVAPARQVAEGVQDRILLTIGRIHPKKGLDNLVRAWAQVEQRFPEWRLRIVGPDEGGHVAELTRLAHTLGLARVSVEPPLYGDAKLAAYQSADVFVLPTLNENFALTVAEALAAGTPAIVTTGAPWRGLRDRRCGWWIEVGVEPLAAALFTAMATPAKTLRAMGQRGRLWMEADFSWDRVASDMRAVYQWLASGYPPPAHVRFD